jgi:processive 1,2-diacylglycerol beta-glucosyltransferase
MGAGHDGAARELVTRLRAGGHHAEVRDFLDAGPLRIGSVLKGGYEFELRHVPSAYDATYRLWYRIPWMAPVVSWLVATLTKRRLLRWVRRTRADVVVSTYPLATLCLGRLRRTGALKVPAVNFITDFGVHPLWVHRGIDLNLAVHEGPARVARERTGRPAVACGPLVSEAYGPDGAGAPGARAAARRHWDLAEGERSVLVVAGSWGVGSIRETFEAIAGDGRFTPVVVCGRDEAVRHQLTALAEAGPGRALVIGWTDEMPSLMAACDALVENAGGLTSLEAMRVGLPVISFRPIAGHGVENTSVMAALGVSRLARSIPELVAGLDALCRPGPDRSTQVATARSMFVTDGARLALAAADAPASERTVPARPVVRRAVRVATSVTAAAGLAWAGLTTGVGVATAAGAGVAHPVGGADGLAYVGVRLDVAELADPATRAALVRLGLTAVVDEQTAESDPAAMRALGRSGIDVANGGRGEVRDRDGQLDRPAQWNRAQDDVDAGRQLARLIGRPVTDFVPGRRLDAFDLMDSGSAHTPVVVPDHVWSTLSDVEGMTGGHIYLLNGLRDTPAQLNLLLGRLQTTLIDSHLLAVPFDDLT